MTKSDLLIQIVSDDRSLFINLMFVFVEYRTNSLMNVLCHICYFFMNVCIRSYIGFECFSIPITKGE